MRFAHGLISWALAARWITRQDAIPDLPSDDTDLIALVTAALHPFHEVRVSLVCRCA